MTPDYKIDEGFKLLEFIESLDKLEWRKFQKRYPERWKNDRFEKDLSSSKPPYSSFRFECEKPEITEKLKKAIATYEGRVQWVMCAHKRKDSSINWTIMPKKMKDCEDNAGKENLTASEYISAYMPEYAQMAFDDLPSLISHISK